jgi:hypothetical protein
MERNNIDLRLENLIEICNRKLQLHSQGIDDLLDIDKEFIDEFEKLKSILPSENIAYIDKERHPLIKELKDAVTKLNENFNIKPSATRRTAINSYKLFNKKG